MPFPVVRDEHVLQHVLMFAFKHVNIIDYHISFTKLFCVYVLCNVNQVKDKRTDENSINNIRELYALIFESNQTIYHGRPSVKIKFDKHILELKL